VGDGVKAGINKVRLDMKHLGPRWQEALEGVLRHLG
jgi:hypothetical protein